MKANIAKLLVLLALVLAACNPGVDYTYGNDDVKANYQLCVGLGKGTSAQCYAKYPYK